MARAGLEQVGRHDEVLQHQLVPDHGPAANLAVVANVMSDRQRAQMLLTLLGETPQSGSALAEVAGILRSLAGAHLKKLVAGGLMRAQPQISGSS